MAELVKQLDLSTAGPLGGEALRPEDAVDPAQQRLYQLLGRRMLDPAYRVRGGRGRGKGAGGGKGRGVVSEGIRDSCCSS